MNLNDKKVLTYKAWAPDEAKWTAWAKPVLFASLTEKDYTGHNELNLPTIDWLEQVQYQTAIIVDKPGQQSVLMALSLAKMGYRPVPLYNGCKSQNEKSMVVDVKVITKLLPKGANLLNQIDIRSDAPPVFLLDSHRHNNHGKQPGSYDNRWCIFPQDMPSATYLLNQGIQQIVLEAKSVMPDLSHVLFRYQEKGIKIYQVKDQKLIEKRITKPTVLKSILYRSSVLFGLRRNSTGGFGGKVPEPYEHNSGMGYRGIG
jgi:hypothetical protein